MWGSHQSCKDDRRAPGFNPADGRLAPTPLQCLVSYTEAACEDHVTGRTARCIEKVHPGSFQGKRN